MENLRESVNIRFIRVQSHFPVSLSHAGNNALKIF